MQPLMRLVYGPKSCAISAQLISFAILIKMFKSLAPVISPLPAVQELQQLLIVIAIRVPFNPFL